MNFPQDDPARLAHARHELRTPINAMLGYGEMLLEDAADSALVGPLTAFVQKSRDLLDSVNTALHADRLTKATGGLGELYSDARKELLEPAEDLCRRSYALSALAHQNNRTDFAQDLDNIASACQQFRDRVDTCLSGTSEPGPGPARAPQSQTPTPQQPASPLSADEVEAFEFADADFRGHVLVVDDNADNRKIAARALWRHKHHFALASGGRQALDMLASSPFDLVLLDLMMPEMNGFEVLVRLKAHPQLRHIPVLMVSALDQIDSITRCIQMGAEDYLPKPFDPVLLETRVGSCLEKKRLRDLELEYLRNVDELTRAAASVEAARFDPDQLEAVAKRKDSLGQLARVFQSMAREVAAREAKLKLEVQSLKVEIDVARKLKQVAEITESDYFQQLQQRAQTLRRRKEP